MILGQVSRAHIWQCCCERAACVLVNRFIVKDWPKRQVILSEQECCQMVPIIVRGSRG